MVYQLISLIGAILILFAFAAVQMRRMESQSVSYQSLNLAGGVCLCIAAVASMQYGFILLEGSWAVLSAHGLLRIIRQGPSSRA
jgi:NADH:ubiquinone oxidoreductase subunit 6 (subunit J)